MKLVIVLLIGVLLLRPVFADDFDDDIDASLDSFSEALDKLTDSIGGKDGLNDAAKSVDVDYDGSMDSARDALQMAGESADSALETAEESVQYAQRMTAMADEMAQTSTDVVKEVKNIAAVTKSIREYINGTTDTVSGMIPLYKKIISLSDGMEGENTDAILGITAKIAELARQMLKQADTMVKDSENLTVDINDKMIPALKGAYSGAKKVAEDAGEMQKAIPDQGGS